MSQDKYNLRTKRNQPENETNVNKATDTTRHLGSDTNTHLATNPKRQETNIEASPASSQSEHTTHSLMQAVPTLHSPAATDTAPRVGETRTNDRTLTNPTEDDRTSIPSPSEQTPPPSAHSDDSHTVMQTLPTQTIDMNILINLITNLGTKIDTKIDETRSKIEETYSETKLEIQACRNAFEIQFQETREAQRAMCAEINALKLQQNAQAEETAKLNEQLLTKIEESQIQMRQFVTENIENQQRRADNEIKRNQEQIISIVNSRLDEHKTDLERKFDELAEKTKLETEQNSKAHINTIQREVLPKLELQNKMIESQQAEIQYINQNLTQFESEVQNLKQKQTVMTSPNPIYITCNGNEYNDRQLPRFNGRSGNPIEYLNKLRRYFVKGLERNPNQNHTDYLRDILEMSFEGPASRWLQLIREDINNWEQFTREFENKYWSPTVQRGIKAKIEAERFRNNGTLNRSEYLTERVLLLQAMTPCLSEEEIVTLMTERFDPIIQDSVSVQNITTIRGLERLLQKEDIKDGPKRARLNSGNQQQTNNKSPYNNNNSTPKQDRFYNQQAYQPKINHQYPSNNNSNYKVSQYSRNNYGNHNDNNYQRNHRDYKPYKREPYPPRNYDQNQKYERNYPTKEQGQICAMYQQNTGTRSTNSAPSSPNRNTQSTNSTNSPPHSRSENDSAL